MKRGGTLPAAVGLIAATLMAGPVHAEPAPIAAPTEQASGANGVLHIGGAALPYRATAGTLIIRDDAGQPTASVFYVAYAATGPTRPDRPVTFLFNGGPGSASLWLDMGGFGPWRAPANAPHPLPPAPYRLEENQASILDKSDLVFIDAVGTGYSRALGGIDPRAAFWGVDQDVDAFARAISRYLTVTNRWSAPKFLFGESYGTTRAAALALKLHNQGIDLNGVIMLSTVLNFSDDLPHRDEGVIGLLPTFAATAWYHGRISGPPTELAPLLDEVRTFANGPYAHALAKGDAIGAEEEAQVADRLAHYTGLSPAWLRRNHLRIDLERFRSELLRDKGLIIGRFDTRFTEAAAHSDESLAVDPATNDPATAGVTSAILTTYRDYIAGTLGYHSDLQYRALYNAVIEPAWDMHHRAPGFGYPLSSPDTALDLASAMRANPAMKVLVMNGLFDMATPFFKTEYDIDHMELPGALRDNIRLGYYRTGHMAYVDGAAMAAMKRDLDRFYSAALSR